MKILINYDFFNAIKNVNEPMNPMKIIRNNKEKYILAYPIGLSVLTIVHPDFMHNLKNVISHFLLTYGMFMYIDLISTYVAKQLLHYDTDIYAHNSSLKLKKLASMLSDINVKTNYDMLLKAELYNKQYCIEHNDNKIPSLKSEKYVYIPSYGYDGKEKQTSILQEHIIGTEEYILSVDEPDREYRRILVNSHI